MTSNRKNLSWFQWMAVATGLIALTGIFLLSSGDAHGADPKPTDVPRSFSNPFADVPGGLDDAWDESEDEEPPAPQAAKAAPTTRTTPAARPTAPSNVGRPTVSLPGKTGAPSNPASNVPDPKAVPGGVEVGGGPPSGIVSKGALPSIQIDTDTGLGKGGSIIVTDFNYPDADIMDLAKTLGKLTGKNFIFDKDVKGKISIVSNGPITVSDAWKAFLTALDINGFTILESGNFLQIAQSRQARDKQVKTFTGDDAPATDTFITRIFPVKYISADEVARVFRNFIPPNSRIIPHEQTNTVIVTDTGTNLAKLAKMLEFLDIETHDAGIEVVTVKYASAVEMAKLIDTLIPGTTAGTTRPVPGRSSGSRSGFTSRRTKEGGLINNILADERTNTLIVHANAKGAEQVRELVVQLDKKMPAPIGGGKVHVIYLQFANAEDIAATLNNISATARSARPTTGAGGVGTNPISESLFEGNIKVSPDKATNSLVITASMTDFVTVERVIKRLDIPRDEVYVEAIIMELNMGRGFSFSSNFAAPARGVSLAPKPGDLANFLASPLGQQGMVLGFKDSGTTQFTINGANVQVPNIMALISAIQSRTQANILATPQIMAMDNTEATFESAEKIPVQTSTTSQGVVSTGINRESVSLSIKIKPQINKVANYVKLAIQTKMEDFSNRELPSAVQNQAFATFERKTDTTVFVADGDTVVLGGLVRDKSVESVSKIPLLGDIPLLGWFFRSKSSEVEKTNLLIFITPRIIRHYERVRSVLDEKLKERDDFIEKHAGGEDPHRDYRDQMIRKLPDIKEIISRKAPTTSSIGATPEESDGEEERMITPGSGTSPDDSTTDPAPIPEAGSADPVLFEADNEPPLPADPGVPFDGPALDDAPSDPPENGGP